MSELPWERWFHKEHADANRLLTENYLLRQRIEELEAALRLAPVADGWVNDGDSIEDPPISSMP